MRHVQQFVFQQQFWGLLPTWSTRHMQCLYEYIPPVGLLERDISHKSNTSPPETPRVQPFLSKTPSCDSAACCTDLPSKHAARVRRSQSDCHQKLRPLSSYPPVLQCILRSSSIHSQGHWEGRPLQRGNPRQSSEGLSSSGLGDSLGSLSSLSRHDPSTAERWPECGEYTAVGTDLHLAVVRGNVSGTEGGAADGAVGGTDGGAADGVEGGAEGVQQVE